jgi:hypothetical protein
MHEIVNIAHVSAYQSVDAFARLGHKDWSLRHGFFADMGGFILETADYIPFPIDANQIHYLVSEGFMA